MTKTDVTNELNKETFCRQDIFEAACSIDSSFKESQMRNFMDMLLSSGAIIRVGRNLYSKCEERQDFAITLSKDGAAVKELIKSRFPLLQFRVWELACLNEFLNHLLAKNRIFVNVENVGCEFVYAALAEAYPGRVLLKPTEKELNYYAAENSIIIDRLVGECPKDKKDEHAVRLEQIIVDLFADKTLKAMISKGDYPDMLERMFAKYVINQSTLFRYAARRNKAEEIYAFVKEKTNIRLLVEEPK